jgi:hypothetical protein
MTKTNEFIDGTLTTKCTNVEYYTTKRICPINPKMKCSAECAWYNHYYDMCDKLVNR